MRLRSSHLLIAIVALLVLGVGVGSAIVVSGKKTIGGPPQVAGLADRFRNPSPAATRRATTSPRAMEPSATAIAVALPTNTVVPVLGTAQAVVTPIPPTEAATNVPALPQVVPPTQTHPTAALKVNVGVAPTDVPIPAVPREERVGGPVSVPNEHDGPRWVSLQIGHYRNENFPEELQHLRNNTGAHAAGVSEVSLNEAVARKTAAFLIERGYNVDILDATVPVGYVTDLFLSIHADGNDSTSWRGFKATAPWNSVPASEEFVRILYEEYGQATGLPTDPVTSVGMADYYAFNPVTYRHAVSSNVPGTLLEMGFVSNPEDRRVLTQQQDRVAWGITNAIDRYFRSGAAGKTPTPYPSFTPTITPTSSPIATFTSTATPTSTPADTSTPVPTELAEAATATAALITPAQPSSTPVVPRPTNTPIPTPTPLQGIITADGRWLPPLSPHVRGLPRPGSSAPDVMLDAEDDEHLMTASGRDQVQNWQQFYVPELGRSVWRKGPLRPIRH
jgi:hypothetical protein